MLSKHVLNLNHKTEQQEVLQDGQSADVSSSTQTSNAQSMISDAELKKLNEALPDANRPVSAGSLRPAFAPARRVCLAVKHPYGIDSDANEFSDVVGGTIVITRGTGIQAQLSFDVVLEDGSAVSGSFSGEFPRFDQI